MVESLLEISLLEGYDEVSEMQGGEAANEKNTYAQSNITTTMDKETYESKKLLMEKEI